MLKLDSGNVLLKPSQRKQLMHWLKRAIRLGERLGNFGLSLKIRRYGKQYDVRAKVEGKASFECHSRRSDWKQALRDIVHALTIQLHALTHARALA